MKQRSTKFRSNNGKFGQQNVRTMKRSGLQRYYCRSSKNKNTKILKKRVNLHRCITFVLFRASENSLKRASIYFSREPWSTNYPVLSPSLSLSLSPLKKKKKKKMVEKHASKIPNTWTIVFLYRGYIPFSTIRDQVGQE